MKTYTDIKQSKKLAEILPLETADMHYNNVSIKGINYVDTHRAELMEYNRAIKVMSKYTINPLFEIIPCWSFTALFDAIPSEVVDNHFLTLHKEGEEYCCCYENYNGHSIKGCFSDNPIDTCVEMILKLHELNLL